MVTRTHFHPGDNLKHDKAYLWKVWLASGSIHHHVRSPHRISSDVIELLKKLMKTTVPDWLDPSYS